jgi:hypothetical protein
MKALLRTIFSPLLNIFERGDQAYIYKTMNRKILIIMGLMFAGIAAAATTYIVQHAAYGYFVPALVFSSVALVCIIVGSLGNERAVSTIWGNK